MVEDERFFREVFVRRPQNDRDNVLGALEDVVLIAAVAILIPYACAALVHAGLYIGVCVQYQLCSSALLSLHLL